MKYDAAVSIVTAVFSFLGAIFLGVGVFLWMTFTRRGLGMLPPFFPWIFMGLGIVFLLVALALLSVAQYHNARRRAVIARGNMVSATVTAVRHDTSVSVNGRHPYVVECSYQGPDQQVYLLSSQRVFTLPPEIKPGETLSVYWDEYDKKHYTVDLGYAAEADTVDLRGC